MFDYRLPHACDLEDTVQEAIARRDELYREIKAEGGQDLLKRVKLAVKIRDPEKRDEVIHRNALESDVIDWTEPNAGNRKAELEADIEEGVQAGTSRLWGDSLPDAESGDGDGEEGDGEEGETVREVQPTNSFTFLD